jgi:enoyl-CoA hydratase
MPELVTVENRGEVAVVRMDRPPANAMDPELLAQGRACVEDLLAQEPGAVVIVGRDGFFTAGVDLKVAPTLDRDGQRAMVEGINALFLGWYSFPRPVVAAVTGHAVAGGLILALCADHRVCADEGRLALTELRAGLPYPIAAISVVRAELSANAARRLVLGASLVEPPEALALGVVDEVRPVDEVLPRAVEVATELAALPHASYGIVKRQLRGPAIEALERALGSAAGDPALAAWVSAETADAAAGILRRD